MPTLDELEAALERFKLSALEWQETPEVLQRRRHQRPQFQKQQPLGRVPLAQG